jgi:hypothetical protein
MDTRWKALVPAEQNREYVALLTYLPLSKYPKIPRFFQLSFEIQRQLSKSPGAIGYSLRAEVLSRNFWTLSVSEKRSCADGFPSQNAAWRGDESHGFAPGSDEVHSLETRVLGCPSKVGRSHPTLATRKVSNGRRDY